MRVGLGVSLAGHLALISLGFLAFPDARPFTVDEIEALPVDLVPVAEVTDLRAGSKNAEPKPEEKPQPKPQVLSELPEPKPAEKPAEKPVEATPEPAPAPAPAPEPEPAEEEVAAIAPEPEPEPAPKPEPQPEKAPEAAPTPEAPAPASLPQSRPTPPKDVRPPRPAEAPARQQRTVARQQENEREFRPDDISALLNKQEPRGGGDPNPAPEPQTFGANEGTTEAAMTQSEIEALKARLYQCWNPPIGVREAGNLRVTISISLQPDGRLAAPPQPVGLGFDPLSTIAAESAIRAVQLCAPYDMLPPEKYSLWRDIEFTFDPSEMLGG